jgi:hypothetical protein
MTLYSSDHEGAPSVPIHSNIVFVYGSVQEALAPYFGGAGTTICYCPDFPMQQAEKLASSYELRWLAFAPRPPGDDDAWYASLVRDLQQRPDTYPMILCRTHDDVYYSRVESDLDPVTVGAYTIELRFDGSVQTGLRTSPRRPRR